MGRVARILSGSETPVELIESAGLVPIPSGSSGCHPVLPEASGRSDIVRTLTPNPFKIRMGSDPINRLTHR